MKKLKPLGNRVIIKKSENIDRTESGIILAGTAKEKPKWATVVAVGPGTDMTKMYIKPGDQVLCNSAGGTEVRIDKIDYIIHNQDDIIAVMVETDEE